MKTLASDAARRRIVPVVVACPLFLQNVDGSVLATALPSMARALHVHVLELNLAITAYLLSLAVFMPASAWLSNRFGARRVFCVAVLVFTGGSALCGLCHNLWELVTSRIVQGIGGAMMIPVGRTLLLRTARDDELMRAMVWFTLPAAVGRLVGPLVGGLIVSVAPWQAIFLLNVPFGVLGVLLVRLLVEMDPPVRASQVRFDGLGLALLGCGLGGILSSLEFSGHSTVSLAVIVATGACGVISLVAYLAAFRAAAKRSGPARSDPVLDLGILRYGSYRTAVLGGFPLKIAVGAAPFLMPLLLQVGLGMSPLDAGLLMTGMAVGSLATRWGVARGVQAFGYRNMLVGSALAAALLFASFGELSAHASRLLIYVALVVCGLCTSANLVTLNTIGYTDIAPDRHAHASTLVAMTNQLSVALGVVLGSSLVRLSVVARHAGALPHAGDFRVAFWAIAVLSVASALIFARLHAGASCDPSPRSEEAKADIRG